MDDLDVKLTVITSKAKDKGLTIVRGYPQGLNNPELDWEGELMEYLDVAEQVRVTILYLQSDKFDLEQENNKNASEDNNVDRRRRRILFSPSDAETPWLVQRLMESTEGWRQYNQSISNLECLWFKDGVGHRFAMKAPWYVAYEDAVGRAQEEAYEVEVENRQIRTTEEATKTFELARQLALHERFPDAANHEKRMFMAEQLFPDMAEFKRRIVEIAELIYWWEVEPSERILKAQKVHELRAKGESIKNIQVLLKMSEAKVRAAIEEGVQ